MSKITLKNITHIYNEKVKAIDNLSMEINDGQFVALLGPSGCGKTTLMRIIAGLLYPTKGLVYFNGEDVTKIETEKRNVAMVFQFPVVYLTMSVYDNLAFPLKAKNLNDQEIKRKVRAMAEFLDLTSYLELKAGQLSADIKQLTALGRALIRDANCLLLDEPLTNVAPQTRLLIREKLLRWRRENKLTTIYVTHDQSEALTLGEMIAVMNKGVLLQYDTPYNIYEKPANAFIAYFIGNPGMNLIEFSLKKVSSKIFLESSDMRISIPHEIAKVIEKEKLDKVLLGIRPEHIKLSKDRVENAIQGTCILKEHMGVTTVFSFKVGSTKIRVKNPEFDIEVGENLYLILPEEHLRIFNLNGELII
ncbi:MAG: ABC transporter ATP-binding protein [Nitrososphaeria archaeon]